MSGDVQMQPATSSRSGSGGSRIARGIEYLWLGVLLLPLVWLFRRALFFGEMFAYRDSSHYYHPFYRYINERWQVGLPLWNPLDNLGQPLLADPTAAVAYPGKLLFTLPLDYELCFAIYVVAHLWLAGCGLYWCAREFRATRQGAFIGALSYELGGQVLFQYCNPIFCIGAAWLPFAVLLLERTLRHRVENPTNKVRKNVILLAFTLAMMVYGGDPQMAYHFAIIATVRAMIRDRPGTWSLWLRSVGQNLRPIVSACVIALLLSALQVLPSIEWTRQSDRAVRNSTSSVWSLLAESMRDANSNGSSSGTDVADLWTRPKNQAGHGSRVYDFSVGPWRWTELISPNISGAIFPENARWIRLLPGEQIAWSPSLYMGLLPLLLAGCRWKVIGGSPTIRWLTWITLLGIAAALGRYGLGWLINELRYQVTPDSYEPSKLLPGFGGVYWFMTVMFPSYASFRYPAKWWTIATFGFAMLAAKGWPALRAMDRRTINRISCGVAGSIMATVLTASLLMTNRNAPSNQIFGPLQTDLAWRWILLAALHTAAVLAGIVILRNNTRRRRLLWLVVFADLAIAQTPLVQTLPVSTWNGPSAVADSASTIYRSPPRSAFPDSWQRNASADRLKTLKTNEIATLMPKHHLSHGIRSLHSGVSMASADYMALWSAFCLPQVGSSPTGEPNKESGEPPLKLLSVLGADLILAPVDAYSAAAPLPLADIETNLVTYRNEHRFPRAWLVTRWSNLGKAPTHYGGMQTRTQEIWDTSNGFPDFRRIAWLEHEASVPDFVASEIVTDSRPATADCELRVDEPERLVIHASLPVRSLLVVRDQFCPGWEAWTVSSTDSNPVRKQLTVYRANRVMRAVMLEPGEQTIEFRYRPKSVWVGAIVTALSFIAAAIVLARDFKSDS